MELKNHDHDDENLQEFVKAWNFVDKQRLGLDEEINEILKEIDITEIFRQFRQGNKSKVETNEML